MVWTKNEEDCANFCTYASQKVQTLCIFNDDANSESLGIAYLITLRSFRTMDILDFATRDKKDDL